MAGALSGGAEIRDKLQAYVESGGHLVITAGSLERLPGGLAGITVAGPAVPFVAGTSVDWSGKPLIEDQPFELRSLHAPAGSQVRGRCGDMPAVVEATAGKGRVTVLASSFGIGTKPALFAPVRNEVDKPLPKPYPLLKHARAVLDETFRNQALFEVGDGLSLTTCRRGPGSYLLGICNNSWKELPFKITSRCGPIESVRESALDQSERSAVGFAPDGFEKMPFGANSAETIAGGDVRVFEVNVREQNVAVIPHTPPAPRAHGRILHLRHTQSIKEEILARPTFFEHFDGVLVDWAYIRRTDADELRREAGWIQRQGLRVLVDVSPGINLFPDLRLVDNMKEKYAESMAAIESVQAKMEILGARDLLLSLQRQPENNYTDAQTQADFQKTVKHICETADARHITVHLCMVHGKPPSNLKAAVDFVHRVGAANLRVAPSIATMLAFHTTPKEAAETLGDKTGLWLAAAPGHDVAGRLWNTNAPIATFDRQEDLARILAAAPNAAIIFDAVYGDKDAEYQDARAMERLVPAMAAPASKR